MSRKRLTIKLAPITSQESRHTHLEHTLLEMKTGMIRYIRKYNLDEKIDDILQEVACAAYERQSTTSDMKAYVFTILKNKVNAALKDRYKQREMFVANLSASEEKCYVAIQDTTLQDRNVRETKDVQIALALNILDNDLSEKDAAVVRMYYLEQKSHDEIAEELNISPLNSRQVKSRTLRKIRRIMDRSKSA